jgi:D-alanyl-D-alanine carboxypeptidase
MLATAAFGEAPLTSMRPVARVPTEDAIRKLVADAGLTGVTGVVVTDLATGEVIEDIAGAFEQPPASTAKAVTALYALEALGAGHRFETRVHADGPFVNGVVEGNLILAGGGDPDLATDDLATLAARLKEAGLREVKGDFLVWDEALRNVDEIDPSQLDHFGYNPTITGLNLNYNRVHFEWKRAGEGFNTFVDARSENYRPAVTVAEVNIVDRDAPVFTYANTGNADRWTVARSSLNDEGSRWLPVRHPALYAGEGFETFVDARSDNYRPAVTVAKVALVDRDAPVFTYADAGDVDQWTVARSSLNDEGSRWLPVRHPAIYAGEVFAVFMRSQGIVLKTPKETPTQPTGPVLANFQSNLLTEQLQFMLRNSINLSAEVTGMSATKALLGQRAGMQDSAVAMSDWAALRSERRVAPAFVDHSGLGDASRISPADMVGILAAPRVHDLLFPILRPVRVFDDAGTEIVRRGMDVRGKTGTLNFVSSLAGYVRTDQGRNLVFTIFSSDMIRREEGKRSGAERPQGALGWGRRARAMQGKIVRHLATRMPS